MERVCVNARVLAEILEELASRVGELEEEGLFLEAQRLTQRTEADLMQRLMQRTETGLMQAPLVNARVTGHADAEANCPRHLSARKAGEPPDCLVDYFPRDDTLSIFLDALFCLSARQAGEPPDCLVDYFPRDDWLLIVDESHITIRGMYFGDRMRKESLVRHGFRLPSALDNRPLQEPEFWDRVTRGFRLPSALENRPLQEPEFWDRVTRCVFVSATPGILDPLVEVRPSQGQMDDLLPELLTRIAKNERSLITTLTKRTAEEVAGFLVKHGLKAAWLHSEDELDVHVGVNLLRERLDLPEVSLVAILDADKEGFLRSDKSLIQTIGRASRHLSGQVILYSERVTDSMHPSHAVILYSERITDSMRRAMDETARRRARQEEYNVEHKITPRALIKPLGFP
ncbi:ultra-violet resistance protein B-domain-containing protein [Baffinella frigidus]|nr:ultra-violet resistance protein B-domain-containing protein [Cryptophyta sp. CCMP2293]